MKTIKAFSRNRTRNDGRSSQCKTCQRHRNIKTRYGLEAHEYEALLKKHNGACGICEDRRGLCVDHDHETGSVRGILCQACNKALGSTSAEVERISRALVYLRNHYGQN